MIAEDLTDLLNTAGTRAEHWITTGNATLRDFQRLVGGRLAKVLRRLHWATRHFGLPDLVPWEYLALRAQLENYDVAHFHDISSAYSPLTVRWVARRLPTVWTFHDCSPFTGGCLYPCACTAFHKRCGRCPQLDRWPLGGRLRLDFTGLLQDIKRRAAAERRFVAVTPSQWMADEAMRSGMFAARPRVIPNWVDSETFSPRPRAALRRELGLQIDRFWVLISAGVLAEERKGARYAIEAIRRSGRDVGVLLVGREEPRLAAELAGLTCRATGFVSNPQVLARWYAAADALLFPSLADNLPCTILETMAAGTPTIGFRVGGVPDLVESRVNGWLVPAGDVAGLIAGLQHAIDEPQVREQWAAAGRRRALERHGRHPFVAAYLDLYAELTDAKCPAPLGDISSAAQSTAAGRHSPHGARQRAASR